MRLAHEPATLLKDDRDVKTLAVGTRKSLQRKIAAKGADMDQDERSADIDRISKLRALASSGAIGGQSSYLNHLIAIYDKVGRLTARERTRIDLFLASRAK